jgi:hypothetical protein
MIPPIRAGRTVDAAAAEIDARPGRVPHAPRRAATDWELRFLSSIRRQTYPLSAKQIRVLRRLAGKCWEAAA